MERSIEETVDWGDNSILYLQRGTLLFRIESDRLERKRPHLYFSYLSPDFISAYRENKNVWKNRCTGHEYAQLEFYIVDQELPVIRLPLNNYTTDDPDENETKYFNHIKEYASKGGLTKEEYECFIYALEITFNIPDDDRQYPNKDCRFIDGKQITRSSNTDYMLDTILDKLKFNGWIRLSDESYMKKMEEVMLTKTGQSKHLVKLLKTYDCQFLDQDLPNLFVLKDEDDHFLETYIQPQIIQKQFVKRKIVRTKKHRMDITKIMLNNIGINHDDEFNEEEGGGIGGKIIHICTKRFFNIQTKKYCCHICDNNL